MKKDIQMENLRIDKPCPVVFTSRNQVPGGFFCKSCTKCVLDFRGLSEDELKDKLMAANGPICGIFDSRQLPSQQAFGLKSKFLFYSLMLASFLGFSVRPINAQTSDSALRVKDTAELTISSNVSKSDPVKGKETKKKRKKYRRRSLFNRKLQGCIDF